MLENAERGRQRIRCRRPKEWEEVQMVSQGDDFEGIQKPPSKK